MSDLDLEALERLEASLPPLLWRGCKDHPEHNSNRSCWGIYRSDDPHAEKVRLIDVGEQLLAIRAALPKLIADAKRLRAIQNECGHRFSDEGECFYCKATKEGKGDGS